MTKDRCSECGIGLGAHLLSCSQSSIRLHSNLTSAPLSVSSPPAWEPISSIPADEQFIIGAWVFEPGHTESGELSREGDYWFDIVGAKREPFAWMPLPAPPASPARENEEP
jgi:hypothetical protein